MSPGDSTVLFRALPVRCRFSAGDRHLLADFASVLSQSVTDDRPFTCLLTNDRALRKLNLDFLGNDYVTDVLSFPSGEPQDSDATEWRCLGDLAISVERAEAQAVEFGHSCPDEVRILMLHGVLHLAGFDHESDRGQMARAERKWRQHFGLPLNLIARSRTQRRPRNRIQLANSSHAELLP